MKEQVWRLCSTEEDTYRQAAQVLGRAFLDEPVSQTVYRGLSREKMLKNLTVDFTGELSVCIKRGEPLHISQDGEVVAAAAIYPPGAYPLSKLDDLRLLFWTVWAHSPYDIRRWMRWLEEAGKHHPQEPHYYLEYIGVEPDQQGKGLGSMILEELSKRADRARVGCYLETASQINLPLYRHYGFEIVQEEEIIGLPAWFMWRVPSQVQEV